MPQLPIYEKKITPEELRELLEIPEDAAPGSITIQFDMPAAEWVIRWIDYKELNY